MKPPDDHRGKKNLSVGEGPSCKAPLDISCSSILIFISRLRSFFNGGKNNARLFAGGRASGVDLATGKYIGR
jgi:hypothetical protein